MTAKTMDEALAEEARRGDEHRAQIRAEGWRAGAEAMRASVMGLIHASAGADVRRDGPGAPGITAKQSLADDIRSLDVPEMPNDR